MANIKRAVTFYSLQDQYARKKMSLEEIMKYVRGLDAGMEFIPDQMMHGTPHPSEETLREWDRMVKETGIPCVLRLLRQRQALCGLLHRL